jgi:hypothetical protein
MITGWKDSRPSSLHFLLDQHNSARLAEDLTVISSAAYADAIRVRRKPPCSFLPGQSLDLSHIAKGI